MQTTVQTNRVITTPFLIIYGMLAYIATLPQLFYFTLLRRMLSGGISGNPFNLEFIFLPLNLISYILTIVVTFLVYNHVKKSIIRLQLFKALFMVYFSILIIQFILYITQAFIFMIAGNLDYNLFILINRFYAMISLVFLLITLIVFTVGLFGIVKPQFSNTSLILGLIYILMIILARTLGNLSMTHSIDQHFRWLINIVYLEQLNILIAVFFLASLKTYKITEEKNTNDVFSTDFSY